jgi:hypothetical protein
MPPTVCPRIRVCPTGSGNVRLHINEIFLTGRKTVNNQSFNSLICIVICESDHLPALQMFWVGSLVHFKIYSFMCSQRIYNESNWPSRELWGLQSIQLTMSINLKLSKFAERYRYPVPINAKDANIFIDSSYTCKTRQKVPALHRSTLSTPNVDGMNPYKFSGHTFTIMLLHESYWEATGNLLNLQVILVNM